MSLHLANTMLNPQELLSQKGFEASRSACSSLLSPRPDSGASAVFLCIGNTVKLCQKLSTPPSHHNQAAPLIPTSMTLCLAVGWRECQCFQNLSCSVGIFSLSKTIITTLCNTVRISCISVHSRLILGALIALSIQCIHALAKGSLVSLLVFYSWGH